MEEIVKYESNIVSSLDRMQSALIECSHDYERLQLRDQARALQAAAAILNKKNVEVQFCELVHRAERAIAKANPPMSKDVQLQKARDIKDGNITEEDDNPLSNTDLIKDIRKVHGPDKLSDEDFESRMVKMKEDGDPVSRTELIRELKSKKTHVSHNSGENEWYTPSFIIEAARSSHGGDRFRSCIK